MEPLLADPTAAHTTKQIADTVRRAPDPLHGGPLALLRFLRANRMLSASYARLIARFLLLKLRYRGRLQTDGLCFICPRVQLEIGRRATLRVGRWAWIGHGSKIRVHEGEVSIGSKTVMGQDCTISAFQHVSIGRECILADRVMLIDFDHGVTEVDRPIRLQGIYKRDVHVGHNVWIGYGACVLRGVKVGDNSVIGTGAVLTKEVPENAVVAGVPARVIRMRDAPSSMRFA
jgi:acetyltransferase-like isoleucine patch superfamily enzyme